MQGTIAEHMEKGFLENIVDMFRLDSSLYEHLPALISDPRSRVRIGTVALVETLLAEHGAEVRAQTAAIALRLSNNDPVVVGDVAYLLEIIGDASAIPYLKSALPGEHPAARAVVEEAIAALSKKEG